MRLSPITAIETSRRSTSKSAGTLLTLVTASTAFLFSISPKLVSGSDLSASIHQRTFRIGHPAAQISKNSATYSIMTSSSSTVGLPSQNEAFEGFASQPLVEPSTESAQLIKDAMDLFSAKPSALIFGRSWSRNAIFADPICYAQGSRQYLAQWYGMPAAFSKSETLEWKLIKDTRLEVQYVQKQRYKVKALGLQKDMVSTVVMERDENTGKVKRFEDRWNHKPLGGILGWPFRRLNALTLPLLVGVPDDTKQAINQDKKD
ncbi:uncharacterized protein MEPE_03599 [Melanopsichium pennsylvanicum]|uniref:Uncharacterized protein n=2 Tax=Melanopsichium pennsylvanicum TaxID=63383 RepID=A0AAJ4XLQ5_9BASI|nr:uncharacterized protein MEPE_03599 [Melanopsichium pennsylvanicum]